MNPIQQSLVTVDQAGRSLLEASIPGDLAGFTGTTGIQFNRQFTGHMLIASSPLSTAGANGGVYLSPIHGGIGSDPLNLVASVRPGFAGPEVDGFYSTGTKVNTVANGYRNTEKQQRAPSDGSGGSGGTLWLPVGGRTKLNFSLCLRSAFGVSGLYYTLQVYRDCNASDRALLGTLTPPFDGQLVYQKGPCLYQANPKNLPTMAEAIPAQILSGSNIYVVLTSTDKVNPTSVVGSAWLGA